MSILFKDVAAVLMDEKNTVLEHAYIAVDGETILSVGTVRPEGTFTEEIDGRGKVLMPGFVNAHTHVPMTLMRGYGDGRNLQDWLNNYIFPVEDKWDPRAIHAATALGLCEMIASGTTCIADMYMFCEAIAQEVAAAGISANLAQGCTQFEDSFDFKTHQGSIETRELADRWHGYNHGQIMVDACIHGEYTSHPALWEALAGYAKEKHLGMHVHVSETKREHDECVARHGKTPTQILEQAGVFDVRAIAAHCVHTSPEDQSILARHHVSAIHNPCSNLKLGSGIAPIVALQKAGVNVALGTDGVSSNNSADMLEDLKIAAILQNGANRDPLALLPAQALKMATVNGAKALGRNAGQISKGCIADLILLDFDRPHLIPRHDTISNLVYAAHGSDVVLNMCRGKIIYRDGAFLTIDLDRVKREVRDYALPLLFGTK
ncbi:MAG: amidohydrolase [Pseudoflavonifractor sp.]